MGKWMRKLPGVAAIAALLFLLAGCTSLRPMGDAKKYPASERAILLQGEKVDNLYVGIVGIDGDHKWRGLKPGGFQLTPGEHYFTVQLNNFVFDGTNISGSTRLHCTFEAGKTYSVQAETSGSRFRAWVQDEQTGQEHPCR